MTITKQELIDQLKKCAEEEDTEKAHANADDLLLDYIGDDEISEAYNAVGKWYA